MATNTVSAPSRIGAATDRLHPPGIGIGATHDDLPTETDRPATVPRTPLPGTSSTSWGRAIASLRGLVPRGQRPPPRRGGDLVERRGGTEDLVGRPRADGDDLRDLGMASGQRAGLVEEQHPTLGEPLERETALDDDAAGGGGRCRR